MTRTYSSSILWDGLLDASVEVIQGKVIRITPSFLAVWRAEQILYGHLVWKCTQVIFNSYLQERDSCHCPQSWDNNMEIISVEDKPLHFSIVWGLNLETCFWSNGLQLQTESCRIFALEIRQNRRLLLFTSYYDNFKWDSKEYYDGKRSISVRFFFNHWTAENSSVILFRSRMIRIACTAHGREFPGFCQWLNLSIVQSDIKKFFWREWRCLVN